MLIAGETPSENMEEISICAIKTIHDDVLEFA